MNFTRITMVIGALLVALPVRADGPDYDSVLILIRNGLNGTFAEQKRCVFRAPGGEFHAGSLEVVASTITASEVHFDCRKQQQCVVPEKGPPASTIKFAVHGNALGLAGELSRLVEMCSGGGH